MAEQAITLPARGGARLPRAISDMIFEDARESSVVQQAARRVPLPFAGVSIPYMTGKPVAAWVAEGGRKPVSDATVGTTTMDPKKIAVIVPFSIEYARADTVDLLDTLRPDIAEAFATAFDAAAIFGTSTPFAAHLAETTNKVALGTGASYYVDLISVGQTLAQEANGYSLNGWLVGESGQWTLAGSVDSEGRPLLTSITGAEGGVAMIGRPAFVSPNVDGTSADIGDGTNDQLVAMAGDWTKCAWGAVGEIEFDVNESASLTLTDTSVLNLWQDNLAALRAEAWYGFVIRDVEAFAQLHTSGA